MRHVSFEVSTEVDDFTNLLKSPNLTGFIPVFEKEKDVDLSSVLFTNEGSHRAVNPGTYLENSKQ